MKRLQILSLSFIAMSSLQVTANSDYDTSLVNNYADDAVVQIQAITPETQSVQAAETGIVPIANANPIAPPINISTDNKTVTMQDMQALLTNPAAPVVPITTIATEPIAVTPTQITTAATPTQVTPEAPSTPPVNNPIVAQPAVTAKVESAPVTPVSLPTAAATNVVTSTPVENASESTTKTEEVKAVTGITPAKTITIETPATSDQVKIVKVYPVYDVVLSAVKNINAAAHDMINYVYNFITQPRPVKTITPEEKTTESAKTESSTENSEPKESSTESTEVQNDSTEDAEDQSNKDIE